jgi:hypothetical protein
MAMELAGFNLPVFDGHVSGIMRCDFEGTNKHPAPAWFTGSIGDTQYGLNTFLVGWKPRGSARLVIVSPNGMYIMIVNNSYFSVLNTRLFNVMMCRLYVGLLQLRVKGKDQGQDAWSVQGDVCFCYEYIVYDY